MSRERFSFLRASIEAACIILLTAVPIARADDADADGLPDAVEDRLGTDPTAPEKLNPLGKYPANRKDLRRLDVVAVDLANVAKDRWLWAVRFAEPCQFDNAMLILYLDADNDPKTGRKGVGCEWMLSHALGSPYVTAYAPDGSKIKAPPPRVAVDAGVLYLCHDAPIKQDGAKSVFRFNVLSETRNPHAHADSTGWSTATGPPNSAKTPPVLLDDTPANENFETTEGLDLIWKLQADPANVVLSTPKADLVGMRYYDAEYRWPAVRGANGQITVTVPKAGTFHPAVVVYDTPGREAYELQIDGKRMGRFVADEDDQRQRVYFLSTPVTLKAGQRLTFRVGATGSHTTEDILLLAKRPPVRNRAFEIRQIEAGHVKRGGDDQIRLTWITTWPAACKIRYGASPNQTREVAEQQQASNHRIYLTGLTPGQTIRFRIHAATPRGKDVVSQEASAVVEPPPPVAGTARRERATLTVENPHDFPLSSFPITSGVPFARGELASDANVRLLDADGKPVPAQVKTAVRWNDRSVKWLHVTFLAAVKGKSSRAYTLEYGTEVSPPPAKAQLSVARNDNELRVSTGPVRMLFDSNRSGWPVAIDFDANADGRFDPGETVPITSPIRAEVVDDASDVHTTLGPCERMEIEEDGPLRAVIKLEGHHASKQHGKPFAYVNRFVFYAGQPFIRACTAWGNDAPPDEFTRFERLSLRIPLADASKASWQVGLGQGKQAAGRGDLALTQLQDDAFQITPAQEQDVKTHRADGWLDVDLGAYGLTVAVRDLWQLYPKGLRLDSDGLAIDLCPDFPDGTYDKCTKLDEIKRYFYLMGGKYKIRRGVRKQHELLLSFHPAGTARPPQQIAQAFQDPPIAVCSPERYCRTLAFGEILPAIAGRTPEYEKVCETVYKNTVSAYEGGHMFGLLNHGDLWGERRVNWCNGEYDHHHAFLLQFIRSGDRRWYALGERAARHAIDVDTCHYGPNRGGEWIHSMGHTGGYFTSQYEGSGIPAGHFTVSHTWTEGFCDWYALSGDPTALENAILVADHYDTGMNDYDFTNTRTNGWHLILTMATYRLTNDPFYLNAARIIVERTLERQSPEGGWRRQMVPGHCHCMPRHRGEANFMLGVLAAGLEEYYREVPDPRVAEAFIGGAKQVVKELWVESANGFRYTSCPKMTGYTANNDMTAEMLFVAHRLGGDPKFADIALRAMQAAFNGGIGSIAHLRWTPHIIYQMDRLQHPEAHAKK